MTQSYLRCRLLVYIIDPLHQIHMPVRRIKRGFALMSKERLRLVTSAAGKHAHEIGKAHTWTKEEAIKAGKIGGKALKGSKWKKLWQL